MTRESSWAAALAVLYLRSKDDEATVIDLLMDDIATPRLRLDVVREIAERSPDRRQAGLLIDLLLPVLREEGMERDVDELVRRAPGWEALEREIEIDFS